MITTSNTSRIPRNPSLGREGFRLLCPQIRSIGVCFGESLTNPSRVGVKDLGGRKSLYRIYISLSSIYPSRSHTHASALRVRTREGVCEGFAGRIRSTSPIRQCISLRSCSHTLAHVGESRVVAPTFPMRHPTQHVATRLRTCDLPLWQANRYSAKNFRRAWPVGTGPRLSRVCFACPTTSQNSIQKGNAMSDFTHPNSSPAKDRLRFWQSIVVPTASAIQSFMWRVAWFGLFVWILFHTHA